MILISSIIDTFMGLDAVILWTPTFWREWLTIIVSILRINAFITVKTQKELENTKTIRFSHKIYTEHTKIKLKVNKFFFYIVINSIISTKHILLVNLQGPSDPINQDVCNALLLL